MRWGSVARSLAMVVVGLGAAIALGVALNCGQLATATASVGTSSARVLISAVHIGLRGFGGRDEGFCLTNVSSATVVLTDAWRVRDYDGDTVAFPTTGVTLPAGASIWCARNALSFTLAFGFTPSLEYGVDSTSAVPNMAIDAGFALPNDGGSITLMYVESTPVDTANGDGGGWPAGTKTPRKSMERIDPTLPDTDTNWGTAVSDTIGVDADGNPITGTPRYTNSLHSSSGASDAPEVVINEVAWMGTTASYYDEWIELYNNADHDIDLYGWLLEAADGSPAIVLTGVIPARGFYLLERTADDTVRNVPADQLYTGALANTGETLRLYRARVIDVVVYGDATPPRSGWSGAAVRQYSSNGIGADGQVLFRKRDEGTGLPLADTDAAADWANDTAPGYALYGPVHAGDVYGKRAMYPGWDWDAYTATLALTATVPITVGIAPDNMYTVVADLLRRAQHDILIEAYTFDSVWLTAIITERIRAGVAVTVLLEGGAVADQELWVAAKVAAAGGHVYFMHNDPAAGIHDRYANQHAKVVVVDGRWVAVGSENLGNHAMPVDDKANGTAGNRGVVLVADLPALADYLTTLFARDCDPRHHLDVVAYGTMARYTVSPTYTPPYSPGGGYEYAATFSATAPAFQADYLEVVHAPETALRYRDGLIALLLRAGAGDEVYVEQLYERHHWGLSSSNVLSDPNPRLEAYIQAARQGARVRVLLDKGMDDRRMNYDTAFYLLSVAADEGLDLDVRLGNPTRRGIHNKMVLMRLGDERYVHVGSINGSEASSKVNREVALNVRSSQVYDYLKQVFDYDWAHSGGPYEVYVPLVFRDYVPESDHVLISEVMFKQAGSGDELGEWVELYNPTAEAVDVSGWRLGDAVNKGDYERLYEFPSGTVIPPGGTLIVARQATAYQALGYAGKPSPDLEWNDSGDVPDMLRTSWGEGEFALGNAGDEVLLLDVNMQPVDVVVYGDGSYPGVVSFGDVSGVYNGNSLERWPANRDSNDCRRDFRVRYAPEPGGVVIW